MIFPQLVTLVYRIFKKILLKERESFNDETRKGVVDLVKVTTFMVRNHVDTAPGLTMLYRLVVTAGYASARCECVFSSLRVDAPQRRSQTTKRETDLTYLHFERKTLMELKFDNFLKIWQSKPRKLFLI